MNKLYDKQTEFVCFIYDMVRIDLSLSLITTFWTLIENNELFEIAPVDHTGHLSCRNRVLSNQ